MNEEHERYIRARFAAAEVKQKPFPHLVIRDVLPPDLYEEMADRCPTGLEAFLSAQIPELTQLQWVRPRKLGGLPIPIVSRRPQPAFAIRVGDRTTWPLSRYEQHWRHSYLDIIDLIDTLTIAAYERASARYVERLQRAGFVRQFRSLELGQGLFTHRTRGWSIPPHVHASAQIIQSMIYFPLPGSIPEQGTVFYRLKRRKVVPAADLSQTYIFAEDEVEEAGSIPYHPNTLASFLNTPLAIHASPKVPGPARRYTFTAAVMSGVSPPDRSVDLQAEFG